MQFCADAGGDSVPPLLCWVKVCRMVVRWLAPRHPVRLVLQVGRKHVPKPLGLAEPLGEREPKLLERLSALGAHKARVRPDSRLQHVQIEHHEQARVSQHLDEDLQLVDVRQVHQLRVVVVVHAVFATEAATREQGVGCQWDPHRVELVAAQKGRDIFHRRRVTSAKVTRAALKPEPTDALDAERVELAVTGDLEGVRVDSSANSPILGAVRRRGRRAWRARRVGRVGRRKRRPITAGDAAKAVGLVAAPRPATVAPVHAGRHVVGGDGSCGEKGKHP
eukprot:2166357-Prymnesium_polylepis.1